MINTIIKYAPVFGVVSYLLMLLLTTPSQITQNTIDYLFNKLHTCPLNKEALHNQTILFDNFYDFTLYNQFMDSMIQYFTFIEPIFIFLLIVIFISLFVSMITVFNMVITFMENII